MKMKKLLSAFLAMVFLATSILSVAATEIGDDFTVITGNNIIGTATEDVLTEFDYVSAEDAKVNASFDVADSTKKEVLNLNFNALEINSTVNSVNVGTGETSYDGIAGVVATVLDNPARDGVDNCIVIGNYHDQRFNIYDGSSYDATFWMQTNDLNWGMYNIQIKPDIYLAYRGANHGDGGHRIGLYAGYSAVSNLPNSLVEAGEAQRLAYIDLSEYGAYMSSNAYWRIVSTYNTVKVYVSSTNDFSNATPVIDVVIPENYANERSILQFSHGNTGMWIDDVVVNEIGNTFNEGGKTLVKDVTFDGPVKGASDVVYQYVADDNYRMRLTGVNLWRTVSLYQGLSGYFSAEFYMAFSNNQWHSLDMSIRDLYALQFRGFGNMGTANNQLLIANNGAEIMRASIPDMTAGVYVKFEYNGTAIKVWVTAAPEFTGEYAETPTLELPLSTPLGEMTDWIFYRQDGEVIMDDLKITSSNGHVIYEEDFDGLGAFNPDKADLRVDETGNVTYVRGVLNEWADVFLFNAPENFEMTYQVHAVNTQWNSAEVYIKNNIGIFIKGAGQSGSGNCEVSLQNGDNEVLARYIVGSKESVGSVPFEPGYIKAIFKGENLKVYLSKTEDFANEELIFDYTFSGLTTTSRAVRVVGRNDEMRYDNFKVYELSDDANTSYKKLAVNGNEMKLLNVSNGAATEISTYTLPFANAKYRVSVGKKDDKLTVYVDGKAVMETESGIEGLVYFEGATPKVKYGEVAPEILLAGDFDYNQRLDATDLMTLRKVILGVDSSAYYMTTLNVNESVDGEVNILDLVRLKKLLVA